MFGIIKHVKRDKASYASELKRKDFISLRGELEIIGTENGKIVHYDKGENAITIWGKHATMHVLTGEVFSNVGNTRSTSATDHVASGDTLVNNDGTIVSGEQYFGAPSWPGTNGWWSRPTSGDSATHLYPFFPVKMLFGTGFEWKSWADIGDSDYYTQYTNDGWNSTYFDDSAINDSGNYYSATFSGDTLHKTRSMNDIYSGTLTTPVIQDTDFAVKGAVKNGLYENSVGDSTHIELVSGSYFLKKNYWGIGKPSFVYAKRESAWNESGAEVALDFDSNVENKITFTVTMPEQTGTNAGIFYPYNGFTLKEAGLFCDARFRLSDTTPSDDADSDDSGLTEFDNYTKIPGGIMVAHRYISPISKSHSLSVTARWSIYL